jgi:predicted metal-dependent phosphoesterase TrpH
MKINLHTHSNCSLDGEFEPNELINKLKSNNYDIVSITDHDTCEAYKKLDNYSNIKIITGMEADAIVTDHTYDFLCYDFNLNPVLEYAKVKYETVEKRQLKIFNKLVELCNKKEIKLNNVESYHPETEYAHSALFRMLDKEFLDKNNIQTAGDLYRLGTVDKNFPLYIDMHIVWPDIKELLDIIHANDGKVFLAHPYRYNKDVNEVLSDIKDYVDGIEICNNPSNKEEVEYLYQFAKNNNLLVSCGSDYHGNNRFSINCEYLTDEMLKDVVSWLKN